MLKRSCLVVVALIGLSITLPAEGPRVKVGDWPELRGPNRDGISKETGLISSWKLNGENFLWRAPYGGRSTPAVFGNRVYVQVPSGRGPDLQERVMALDADSGKVIWEYKYNMFQSDVPAHRIAWASPAVDAKLNLLYVTSGNNYSDPTSTMSDSFIAMDLNTGQIKWSKQMTAKDAYTAACRLPDKTNCAESNGPDFDFSSSPILITMPSGRRMLVAGQKSGVVHALDPDKGGEILWQTRVGRGGILGGVQARHSTRQDHARRQPRREKPFRPICVHRDASTSKCPSQLVAAEYAAR